jgi:hypothetical protein
VFSRQARFGIRANRRGSKESESKHDRDHPRNNRKDKHETKAIRRIATQDSPASWLLRRLWRQKMNAATDALPIETIVTLIAGICARF